VVWVPSCGRLQVFNREVVRYDDVAEIVLRSLVSMRSKSFERAETAEMGLVHLPQRVFVVVAAAYQRPDTHNLRFSTFDRQSRGSDAHGYLASYISEHLYPSIAHYGTLTTQTRATSTIRPDMGRRRRRFLRSRLVTCRQDTPRMGTQAGDQEDGTGSREEDLAQIQPQVACCRHH
jgi:hypothetical protein